MKGISSEGIHLEERVPRLLVRGLRDVPRLHPDGRGIHSTCSRATPNVRATCKPVGHSVFMSVLNAEQ